MDLCYFRSRIFIYQMTKSLSTVPPSNTNNHVACIDSHVDLKAWQISPNFILSLYIVVGFSQNASNNQTPQLLHASRSHVFFCIPLHPVYLLLSKDKRSTSSTKCSRLRPRLRLKSHGPPNVHLRPNQTCHFTRHNV